MVGGTLIPFGRKNLTYVEALKDDFIFIKHHAFINAQLVLCGRVDPA